MRRSMLACETHSVQMASYVHTIHHKIILASYKYVRYTTHCVQCHLPTLDILESSEKSNNKKHVCYYGCCVDKRIVSARARPTMYCIGLVIAVISIVHDVQRFSSDDPRLTLSTDILCR